MTKTIETISISVESAMMFGLIPCFTDPKIAVGRVSTPAPLTKFVMMKSSSEMMKASRNPARNPGGHERHENVPERLRPARVEIPCGFLVDAFDALEPRRNRQVGEGDAEDDVRHEDRA